jgi:hypothetical protein
MGALVRQRISYSLGNENNPGDPFGRHRLVIEVDGRARLDHFGGKIGRGAWVGTVKASALDALWGALERSAFPKFPMVMIPAGGACHDLYIGAGPASGHSVFLYIYAPATPGYSDAFEIIAAIIRQMSDPADASPPDAMKVEAVTRVDPADLRFAVAPSPGTVFLFAYLSSRRLAQGARADLLDRYGANAKATLLRAIEAEQTATSRDETFLYGLAGSFDILLPPPRRNGSTATELEVWLREIATSIRPRLTTPALEAAWSAGEAARLVAGCVGLVKTFAPLRAAEPQNAALNAHAAQLARDLADRIATLKSRLDAMRSPLVAAQAARLDRPEELAADVHALLRDIARAVDSAPPIPAPKPKPSIERFLPMSADAIDYTTLDAEALEQLALQTTKPALATSALREIGRRSNDGTVMSKILWAKPWNDQVTALAVTLLYTRDVEAATDHMNRMLLAPEPCPTAVVEAIAANVASDPERFVTTRERALVRMLVHRFSKIDHATLRDADAVEKVLEINRRAIALGR